jgi:hypothetical protein
MIDPFMKMTVTAVRGKQNSDDEDVDNDGNGATVPEFPLSGPAGEETREAAVPRCVMN